jgi:hypothetical protein
MGSAALLVREVADRPYQVVPHGTRETGSVDHIRLVDSPARPESSPAATGGPLDAAVAVDPDVIEELGDEIATLSAHIHAATYRLLVLIAEYDRLRGWELGGYQSCAHWLAFRTRIDLGTAREKVRAARALEQLPLTSAAMSRGELSFSQIRAISRAATPETESALLELALGATTEQLERMVRSWRKSNRRDEAALERERFESRMFSVFPDDDGMYVVRGRLTPEVGALLMRAVEAAGDALFREQRVPSVSGTPRDSQREPGVSGASRDSQREAAQRRAEAVGLLAERALAAGFGTAPDENSTAEVPISGTRAERYQVVLHVEPATLSAEGEPGRSELEDGVGVSAESSRRLSCDASVVRVTHDGDGSVLDVGRKTRTIPPALRRALEVRDQGCRFPGCGLRFTDAHHVVHWSDGGHTNLSNCLLLCGLHHSLVHEGGWRVDWLGKGRPLFTDPRGQAHFDGSWQPPALSARPVAALIEDNRRLGVEPDAWTASARWRREADILDSVYCRASETQ